MKTTDINVLIFEGDHVVDNMDNTVRTISQIQDHGDNTATVNLEDGGCMDLDEISFDDLRMSGSVEQAETEFNLHQGVPDMHTWDNHKRRGWILDRADEIRTRGTLRIKEHQNVNDPRFSLFHVLDQNDETLAVLNTKWKAEDFITNHQAVEQVLLETK